MSSENDHEIRLQAARQELGESLQQIGCTSDLVWRQTTHDGVATVLAFEPSEKADGTQLEEMVGVAIQDSQGLFLAVRSGRDWRVSKP